MHGADACRMQVALQPQIEIRRIDTDEDIGAVAQEMVAQFMAQAHEPGHMADHLGQTHHRQVAAVGERPHPGCTHRRAGDAGQLEPPARLPHEACGQRAAQLIAG
jgi:uncharacterized protein with ATP-grasp and redox domains